MPGHDRRPQPDQRRLEVDDLDDEAAGVDPHVVAALVVRCRDRLLQPLADEPLEVRPDDVAAHDRPLAHG